MRFSWSERWPSSWAGLMGIYCLPWGRKSAEKSHIKRDQRSKSCQISKSRKSETGPNKLEQKHKMRPNMHEVVINYRLASYSTRVTSGLAQNHKRKWVNYCGDKATRLESEKKSAIAKIMSHKITKTCKPLSDQCVNRMDEPLIERLFNV